MQNKTKQKKGFRNIQVLTTQLNRSYAWEMTCVPLLPPCPHLFTGDQFSVLTSPLKFTRLISVNFSQMQSDQIHRQLLPPFPLLSEVQLIFTAKQCFVI